MLSSVFAVCFIAGLLLAVFVMLNGVERPAAPAPVAPHLATGAHDPRTEPSALVNRQNVAGFVMLFGAAGYLLLHHSPLGTWAVVGASAVVGALGFALSAVLLSRWAIPGARREVVDERYLMQGHPARVTRAIPAGGDGEIVYEADGREWSVGARSWDGQPLPAGAEVAIDRVEGGVAYVEQWAEVEARL